MISCLSRNFSDPTFFMNEESSELSRVQQPMINRNSNKWTTKFELIQSCICTDHLWVYGPSQTLSLLQLLQLPIRYLRLPEGHRSAHWLPSGFELPSGRSFHFGTQAKGCECFCWCQSWGFYHIHDMHASYVVKTFAWIFLFGQINCST